MKNGKFPMLIVEDDVKLAQALIDFFSGEGYLVMHAKDGEAAIDLYFSNNREIDIILLDVMLPKVNGYEVLKTIREYSSVPIIMTTSKESEEEQLEGLKNGADNYITKPFRLRVLKAHVEVLLNRQYNKNKNLQMGELVLDVNAQKAYLGGNEMVLTPKEFALLLYFMQNKNVVLTREAILNAVWGFNYEGDIRTIDTLVKQLRKKMTDEYPYIHSVYGVGYCFEEETND